VLSVYVKVEPPVRYVTPKIKYSSPDTKLFDVTVYIAKVSLEDDDETFIWSPICITFAQL